MKSTSGTVSVNTFCPRLTTGLSLPVPGNTVTGNDFSAFGAGVDLVVAETVNMTTNPTAENLTVSGAPADVEITGNALGNTINGADGRGDVLSGGLGNDHLLGRAGTDTLT